LVSGREKMKRTFVLTVLLLTVNFFAVGCTAVEPWERGNLAKAHMALDPNPANSAIRAHTYSSREAATGGDSAVGGGCGCN
jgi:hypothetical protein